jgi:uncharacterized membrane protein
VPRLRTLISGRTLYWAFAGLVLGGILHIAAVLLAPSFVTASAWTRLKAVTRVNTAALLAPAEPSRQPIPFMAPDVRYAVCRFDLSSGAPLTVRGKLLDASWSIGLYTPAGDNFYAMTAADLQRGEFDIVINPPPERSLMQILQALLSRPREVRDAKDGTTLVIAPEREGLAIVRAPLLGRSFQREAEQALGLTSCNLKTR